ncbi:MAG: PAS domain-containing protein [Candidatus Sphingomonas colombiensis]|nr:PAS domain-containing protein [Sphingomonas sp.]WEK44992.1 MAG: PAS domain-containing protein [Sphingomonas sp.]
MSLYDLAGAREDGVLDDLVRFASQLCEAPVALVSVVEEQFQRFLARFGTDLTETPRSQSFCAHAMHGYSVMEVPDATRDPRFAANPLVTAAPFIRFYAGAPLVTADGLPLGALCVIDDKPRSALTPFQRDGMAILASTALGRLEKRRTAREALHTRAALADSEIRFRTLADTMPQIVWSARADGDTDYSNARWYEYTGTKEGDVAGDAWSTMFHPDDQPRARQLWAHSITTGEPYQIEYRLRHHDGEYRWVLGRALPIRDAEGRISRWFGTCTDIHAQKLALEEREVISQELAHRIKNIFSVVAGLIQFTARIHPEFVPAAADLRERVTALGRAHDFVRPHSAESQSELRIDSLHGLLAQLFEPYQAAGRSRITVSGGEITIDDRAATPIALLFHELATNATKYGALSLDDGAVAIEVVTDPATTRLLWRESGGPPVDAPAGDGGFGSRLIELSVVRQLGGSVRRDWHRDGLAVEIEVPSASLSRAG